MVLAGSVETMAQQHFHSISSVVVWVELTVNYFLDIVDFPFCSSQEHFLTGSAGKVAAQNHTCQLKSSLGHLPVGTECLTTTGSINTTVGWTTTGRATRNNKQ